MIDATSTSVGMGGTGIHTSEAAQRRLRKRYAAERRFRAYGIAAVATGLVVLAILLFTIVSTGYSAFYRHDIVLDVMVDPEAVTTDGTAATLSTRPGDFQGLVNEALYALFPQDDAASDRRAMRELLSSSAGLDLRAQLRADPELLGQVVRLTFPVTSNVDQALKGNTPRDVPERQRRITDQQFVWLDTLQADGRIATVFNDTLFTAADSRQPEQAGLWAAIKGSFFTLIVCLGLSFPVAIGAAIYLEEFAPKNRLTDLIEVNINNLAAVPSIIFGLLGLAVFIQLFGLPRSAPLVGGIVLALMTLPTIIIATRASMKAVPPSIREAALGMGASKMQSIFHHVVPLAMPGILTGTIIGMAQALGETAPLLMIGMNAFMLDAPSGITSPSTALPAQIYIWAGSSERGFVERTSAAIMVLLAFLIFMNAFAIWLRKRFERRW